MNLRSHRNDEGQDYKNIDLESRLFLLHDSVGINMWPEE